MQSLFGVELPTLLVWFLAFVIVFALLGLFTLVLRKLGGGRLNLTGHGGRSKQARLGVVDALDLDRQRQLVIVRRDGVEHLLLLGGLNDLLIEANIQHAVGAVAPREHVEPAPEARPTIRAVAPAPAAATPPPSPGGRRQLAAELLAELTPPKSGPDPRAAPPMPPRPAPTQPVLAAQPEGPAPMSRHAKTSAEPPRSEPVALQPRIAPEPAPEIRARAKTKAELEPGIGSELKMGPDHRIEAPPRGGAQPRVETRVAATPEPASSEPPAAPLRRPEDQPSGEPAERRAPLAEQTQAGESRADAAPPREAEPRPSNAPSPEPERRPSKAPAPPPEAQSAATRSAKAELSDMARRLEEALRKPFMTATTPAAPPPPARPVLAPMPAASATQAEPLPPGARARAAEPPPRKPEPRPDATAPAKPAEPPAVDFSKPIASQTIPGEDLSGLDELEQEMKRLLGRSALKPED